MMEKTADVTGGERQREGRRNCKDVDERKATTQPEVIYYTSNTHTPPPPLLLPLSLFTPGVVLSQSFFSSFFWLPLHFHFTPSLCCSVGSLRSALFWGCLLLRCVTSLPVTLFSAPVMSPLRDCGSLNARPSVIDPESRRGASHRCVCMRVCEHEANSCRPCVFTHRVPQFVCPRACLCGRCHGNRVASEMTLPH